MNDNITLGQKILTYVLDFHYDRILNFFKQVAIEDFDVLIFTTRRCLILYYIYSKYVFSEDVKKLFDKKTILSDKAIMLNKDLIRRKKCAVLDDVVIHGRSLTDVVNRVKKADPKTVKSYVYAFNEDAECLIDYCSYYTKDHSWEELSNKIVAAIILLSYPYAVYAYSFSEEMSINEYIDFEKNLSKKYSCSYDLDLSLNESNLNNEISELISKSVVSKTFFIDDNFNEKAVRVYYNKLLKTCTIIPFCFIKNLSESLIDEFIKQIKYSKYDFTNAEIQTKYRLIQTCCSLNIIKDCDIFQDCMNEKLWHVNAEQVDSGYFKDIYSEIKFNDLAVNDVLKASKDLDECSFKSGKNDNNVYYDTTIDERTLPDNIDELEYDKQAKIKCKIFISMVHINEDASFSKISTTDYYKEKQRGISLPGLCQKVFNLKINKDNNQIIRAFYAAIVECFDTGLFTLYPEKIETENGNYCSEFLITGEQVCRLFYNQDAVLLKEILQNFILKKSDYKTTDAKKLKSKCENSLSNFFKQYTENSGENCDKIESEVMKSFYEFDDPRSAIDLINGQLFDEKYLKIFYVGSNQNG